MEDEVPYGDDLHRDFVTELGRAWHNFVAAAKIVADHMRCPGMGGVGRSAPSDWASVIVEIPDSAYAEPNFYCVLSADLKPPDRKSHFADRKTVVGRAGLEPATQGL